MHDVRFPVVVLSLEYRREARISHTKVAMRGSANRLPFGLGLLVRRRTNPTDSVGFIVGLVLRPSNLALVRWRGAAPTFDAGGNVVEVYGRVL
jgi:hypothetical protein